MVQQANAQLQSAPQAGVELTIRTTSAAVQQPFAAGAEAHCR
jgi:hypothetical protein